jgi:haloalkane dehalogenase
MDPSTKVFLEHPIRYVQTNAARICYRQFGQGPSLLFLHGWPLSGITFRKLVPYLSGRFTCYVIDLPGGGDTEWTDATDFSWPGQAATLKQWVDLLGLESYYVFGQDSGAMIARLLVLSDSRAQKLIMTNTEIPNHRPPFIPLFRLMMFLPGTNFVMRLLLRSRWFLRSSLGFGGSFCRRELIDGDFTEYVVRPLIDSARRLEGHNGFLRGWDWKMLDTMAEVHQQVAISVLMLWGENDPTFPLANAREMAGQFQPDKLHFHTIANAKLFVQEEQPEEVARLASAFLLGPTG